jgi:hypothetical protein
VIQLLAVDVVLVLLTEKITLQPVLVKMVIMKMIKVFVKLVIARDVKPVLVLLITVSSVKLPESKIHHLVHVTMDIMKMKLKTVLLVLILVPPVTQNVTDVVLVLVSELTLQPVTAQINTLKTQLVLVPSVVINVPLVKPLLVIVPLVPPTENKNQKTDVQV